MRRHEIAKREGEVGRYEPFGGFKGLSGVSELFDEFFAGWPMLRFSPRAWTPRVDVQETDKEYVISAALPGVKREDVRVCLEGGMLTIAGECRQEREEKDKSYLRRELSSGRFERSFSLPGGVHPEQIKAKYSDGILTLNVPKPAEQKSRGVDIKVE